MTDPQVRDRVRVSHKPTIHGIIHRLFRAQGVEWASIYLPDARVGYCGRTVNHPVRVLDIVSDDPAGWIPPEDRR